MEEKHLQKNVFKIGSCWDTNGDPKRRIFETFKKTNFVFIGENQDGSTNYIDKYKNEVNEGDYFAIAEGLRIVAVAKVVSDGKLINNFKDINEEDFPAFSVFDYAHETEKNNAFGWKVEIRYPKDNIIEKKGIKVGQKRSKSQ